MAIKFRHTTSIVTEWHATRSSMNVTDEYLVRNLGRRRWLVVRDDDGSRWTLSTSRLQRFFRPRSYECGYYSSGEPVRVYEEVYITRA